MISQQILDKFHSYIASFNAGDDELIRQKIPNEKAAEFLQTQIPMLDCPDPVLEKTYYFRWWTFRKHIRKREGEYVLTEFLPDVPWAGKYNTINAAVGHHLCEGRWLRNAERYLKHDTAFG